VWLSLREVTALWRFNGRFDNNLDVVVLQRHQSEGGMNSFATEAASVNKGGVAQEDQALRKRPSRENLCLEPVESCRYRSSTDTISGYGDPRSLSLCGNGT
jgi:hypothetical protein